MDSATAAGSTLRPATAADWPAIAEIFNAAYRADGAGEFRTAESLASENRELVMERDVVIAEVAGEPVGYGWSRISPRDGVLVGAFSGAVHPAHQRRGIGTAMLGQTMDAVGARLAADPRPMPHEFRCMAYDLQPGRIALLAAAGFVPIRFGYEMRRSLTGTLPDHPLPPGLELRPLVEQDYRAVFDANEEAFLDHWGHRPATAEDFQDMCYGPDASPDLWCVAWDGDQVAGVVANVILRDEVEQLGIRRGWLDNVSVRRPWRGRGVAKALCSASMRVLRAQGMDEAWLGVDGANPTGAVRLYEHLGFVVAKGWKVYGRPVDALAPPHWRSSGDRATMEA